MSRGAFHRTGDRKPALLGVAAALVALGLLGFLAPALAQITQPSALAGSDAATTTETQIAQATTPLTTAAQNHLAYWQKKAKEFAAAAQATDSPTKKEVMAMLVDDARKRADDAQQRLDALENQERTPTRPNSLQSPPRTAPQPRPPMAAPQPATPPNFSGGPMPLIGGPGSFASGECPPGSTEQWNKITDPDAMVQLTAAKFACGAPSLRESAQQYRRFAAQDQQSAGQQPTALTKSILADQAAAKLEIANGLDQVAGRLGGRVAWSGASIVAASSLRTQDAGRGLCPALTKPPVAKNESNDPYVVCDCVRGYVTERLAPLYEAMLARIKPQSSFANAAMIGSFDSYKDLLLAVTLLRSRGAMAPVGHCTDSLFLAERMRAVNAEYGPDPGLAPSDGETTRNSVYSDLTQAISDLWSAFYGEIGTGAEALEVIDQDQEDVFGARRKALLNAGQTDLSGLCPSVDAAAQERVDWLGREVPALAAPMLAARAVLAHDLKLWQDFAARDGWPDRPHEVSFAEMADRLSTSSHLLGWSGKEFGFVEVHVGTGHENDHGCDTWRPHSPASLYMMAGAKPDEAVLRPASPKVMKALRDAEPTLAYGPFASAKMGGAILEYPLFEAGSEEIVAFFSGADVTQRP